ncbi:putative ankyrin repeat-containing protein-like [Capsicum annuum]|nr:putative ankyrin repeat-containing protein-like [Capsicum annuum]
MDPTLYNAAMEGNISNGDFLLAEYLKRDEENAYQVTPTGNTILHVAVHYGRSHFMAEVLKISPAMLCHRNKKNETALHIAANEGRIEVVHLLLSIHEHHKETIMRTTDENGDTALHKALRSRHQDVARLSVKEDPEFEFPSNKARETTLYLATESGLCEDLSEILNSCKQPTSSSGPLNRTPLHAAVIQEHTAGAGKVDVLHELLNHCPDCCEMLDSNGRNALLEAIFCSRANVVPLELKDHPRAKKMSYNKENKTPFDVAVSCTEWTDDKDRIAPSLFNNFFNSIVQLGRHSPKLNQMDRQKIIFNQAKERDINIKAGFTLPGGFESDDNSPNKGMAILIRKSAFRAFVITDAIAFACSAGAIFSYFYMATNPRLMSYQDLGYLWSLSKVGARSQLVAMSAVVIAFVTGMYATLAHSVGLAVTVCSIGCISFILYVWAVLRPGRVGVGVGLRLFRLAKARERMGRDLDQVKCIEGEDGRVLVEDALIKKR